jgi:hypothetical protein
MSIPVSLSELPDQISRFGPIAYLVTVGGDSAPRAASVSVEWNGDLLMAGAGRATAVNIRQNSQVTLLWPAVERGGHALIVDGWADVRPGPGNGLVLVIQPSRAVLHITHR